MSDYDDSHDPAAGGLAGPPAVPEAMRAFALCRNGFVQAVRSVGAHLRHPFGDVEMHVMGASADPAREHVIEVTGATCHPGYMVDNKGNVAPSGGRTVALPIDAPGYHDPNIVPPVSTSELASTLARPPIPNAPGLVHPAMTDSRIEARDKADPASVPENHEHEHGVQEHHEVPEGKPETDVGDPTGFAAVDAKAHD